MHEVQDESIRSSTSDDKAAGNTLSSAPWRPLGWREIVSVLLLVVISDLTVFRGQGFAGYALLFVAAPLLLMLGSARSWNRIGAIITGAMLVLLALKMVWCGSLLLVAAGFGLLAALAMTLNGRRPYVIDLWLFAWQAIPAGCTALFQQGRGLKKVGGRWGGIRWLSWTLPLAAVLVFGLIFVFANPDLLSSFSQRAQQLVTAAQQWLINYSPDPVEFIFWLVVACAAIGALRPLITESLMSEGPANASDSEVAPAAHFAACRNTLMAVIVLFAVYLIFEFSTLWFREFPDGFHYSGYAHEGAAWLTVALALATGVLSVVFRGKVARDARVHRLRRLAWIWSAQNLLLALAVYNRLFIYVGFNGMTRMRIVGLFGITTVVVGFLLVLWKIAHNRDFVWLLRRQLWALAVAAYLFALTPVDAIWVSYNVRRIMAGDPAPSVQISVHSIGSEGVLLLRPLLDCEDETIREGVRAMLAQRQLDFAARNNQQSDGGWTAFQWSDRIAHRGLDADSERWVDYSDQRQREEALERFHTYAFQWY